MNKYQRIILVAGAILLLLAILTTPKVFKAEGGTIITVSKGSNMYELAVMDVGTAFVRGFVVLGVTVLIFFAFRNVEQKDVEVILGKFMGCWNKAVQRQENREPETPLGKKRFTGTFLNESGKEVNYWFHAPSEEMLRTYLAEKGWRILLLDSVREPKTMPPTTSNQKDVSPPEHNQENVSEVKREGMKIRGWLLFFTVSTFWGGAINFFENMKVFSTISVLASQLEHAGYSKAVYFLSFETLGNFAVAGAQIYMGILILSIRPHSVRIIKLILLGILFYWIFSATLYGCLMLNNTAPYYGQHTDTYFVRQISLIFILFSWHLYFKSSKRVRATFQSEFTSPQESHQAQEQTNYAQQEDDKGRESKPVKSEVLQQSKEYPEWLPTAFFFAVLLALIFWGIFGNANISSKAVSKSPTMSVPATDEPNFIVVGGKVVPNPNK